MKTIYILLLSLLLTSCSNDNDTVEKIINPPTDYIPKGKLLEIRNLSTKLALRYAANIEYSNAESQNVMEKEIRYWMFEIWKKHPYINAVNIRCFYNINDAPFKSGTFAPMGEWSQANMDTPYEQYKVTLN